MKLQKNLIYNSEWNILVVLDACRYDVFKEKYGKMFNVEAVKSLGSCTVEWFKNTFDKKIENSIYVSGNPYVNSYSVEVSRYKYRALDFFDKIINVWDFGWSQINGIYTVDPAEVYRYATIVSKLYPRSKIVVHFLQPHAPYPMCSKFRKYFENRKNAPDLKFWDAIRKGVLNITRSELKECYIRNLEWVMKYVLKLISKAKNKTVIITADHGEGFGENNIYNHPCGVKTIELTTVPWVRVET